VAIARCGNVYGGGDLNWSRIVPGAIRAAIQQIPLEIRSDGRYIRDYIYVKDVVAAYLQLAEKIDDDHVRGEAFNFGPGRGLSVFDIIERIEISMAQEVEKHILDVVESEIFEQYLDPSNAEKVLDWQPKYSLDEGLRETISWYREYFNKIMKSN
jgi:CDP-glucose 4,6-dehydratase